MTSDSQPRWLAWIYAGTIFLSAFLLFQVQPLISKFILPWFGGTPAVWTTCMLFFQVLLFGGYLYAHLTEQYFGPRLRAAVHLALLIAAVALLPIVPAADWKPQDSDFPTWRILGLLGVTVGLPYFVLSTTGPLLQAWYSRTYPGRSPYRLYSLSNIGSLLALLSYPFLVEPALVLGHQAWIWSGAFILFAVLCGYASLRVSGIVGQNLDSGGLETHPTPPTWGRRLLWLALPAYASMMLLATTNHACQDVAVIPFLWVLPLSLYLLSFIICFDREQWYRPIWFALATILLYLATAAHAYASAEEAYKQLPWLSDVADSVYFFIELGCYFGLLFMLCMLSHGELVRLRPSPRYLTSFYLMIAAGGALGGLFVSLLAPKIFPGYLEWPIGLALGYVLAALVLITRVRGGRPILALALVSPAVLLAIIGVPKLYESAAGVETMRRNFYGVVSVAERTDGGPEHRRKLLYNGRIVHGIQFVEPQRRRMPTSYYSPDSGIGFALGFFRAREDLRVGTVGLGVGTTSAYALEPSHVFRFYEINPIVKEIAYAHFHYLEDCPGKIEVVMGDARLSMEREPPQRYHVLALDAFSGDAIPAHLLTREAMDLYINHLATQQGDGVDGAIAVHISNRYLDLAPVVYGLAAHFRLPAVTITNRSDDAQGYYGSTWILLTRNQQLLDAAATLPGDSLEEEPAKQVGLWTDDYSNLFEILKWN